MSITPPIGRRRRKKELRGEKLSDWERLRADAYVTKKRFVPYYCFFLKFCKKGCCGGWGEKWCFLLKKKFDLLSFFFLLLSFRSKMRMIEVFVSFFFEMRGRKKGKGGIVWNNIGQPMIKQIAVVVPQVGICVNIFSRMNESCVWKQKTFLFFFLSSSSSW